MKPRQPIVAAMKRLAALYNDLKLTPDASLAWHEALRYLSDQEIEGAVDTLLRSWSETYAPKPAHVAKAAYGLRTTGTIAPQPAEPEASSYLDRDRRAALFEACTERARRLGRADRETAEDLYHQATAAGLKGTEGRYALREALASMNPQNPATVIPEDWVDYTAEQETTGIDWSREGLVDTPF